MNERLKRILLLIGCALGSKLLHGHRDLELLLQLLDGLVMLVLLLLQSLDLCVTPLDLLVDEFHALANVLAALLQLLAHQHRSVELKDLEERVRLCGVPI